MTPLEAEKTIDRLVEIVMSGKVLTSGLEEARQLGLTLHNTGGLECMQDVFYLVAAQIPRGSPDEPHPSELTHAWHGVGDWLS